jgi:hypothetical protein
MRTKERPHCGANLDAIELGRVGVEDLQWLVVLVELLEHLLLMPGQRTEGRKEKNGGAERCTHLAAAGQQDLEGAVVLSGDLATLKVVEIVQVLDRGAIAKARNPNLLHPDLCKKAVTVSKRGQQKGEGKQDKKARRRSPRAVRRRERCAPTAESPS